MRAEVEAAEQSYEQCGSFSRHKWGKVSKDEEPGLIKTFRVAFFQTMKPLIQTFGTSMSFSDITAPVTIGRERSQTPVLGDGLSWAATTCLP